MNKSFSPQQLRIILRQLRLILLAALPALAQTSGGGAGSLDLNSPINLITSFISAERITVILCLIGAALAGCGCLAFRSTRHAGFAMLGFALVGSIVTAVAIAYINRVAGTSITVS